MSRLDSFIRRLEAQRACLKLAVELLRGRPGHVIEMGLGNGRTYDHLRELCPDREIFVFERQVAAHPDCIPDPEHLVLGDIEETLPGAAARFAGRVALVHMDIGCGDPAANRRISGFISEFLPRLLASGGLVVSDQAVDFPGARPLDPPAGVAPGRYHLNRLA
ncbi:MAG: class I SAM-dependent methyltransferase [Rhodospirillales bacterium]|nr:class I SAM-dependent methyltransferase [Rhodospirillales bacterium]